MKRKVLKILEIGILTNSTASVYGADEVSGSKQSAKLLTQIVFFA